MQDYFKYDNIQRGFPLFMKSDSDGNTDKQNSKLPLGIKSTTQGIQHFSSWNELSNSIEANKGVRFEDSQPNSVFFADSVNPFYDKWNVNDIKICDNMGFVCYEDYTDIRKQSLGSYPITGMYQTYSESFQGYYCSEYRAFANLLSTMIKINDFINEEALSTIIIKISLPTMIRYGNINYYSLARNMYFTYGGKITNQSSYPSVVGSVYGYLPSYNIFSTASNTKAQTDDYRGKFFLVDQNIDNDYSTYVYLPIEIFSYSYIILGGCSGQFDTDNGFLVSRISSDGLYISGYDSGQSLYAYDIPNISAEFIKIQPYRKCGKIDIYTKKSGIFTTVINNSFTSPSHGLQTNNIIKITSALFDGTQTGASDIHPLNGEKFVKTIDSDTIELYDDQFFENPSSTNNLKTSSGINWLCVGSTNGNFAQSWKYKNTLYSPTGKNGYTNNDTIPNSSITTSRIGNATLANNTEPFHSDITIDFVQNLSIGVSSGKIVKNFLDSIPEDDALGDIKYGAHDIYPFFSKSELGGWGPYFGNRFGCSIDVKFLRNSGDSKIYLLAVGERGSDVSVDLFGIEPEENSNSLMQIATTYETDSEYKIYARNPKRIPKNLPYGKIHLYNITVDKYQRITNISYQTTIHGDGSCTYHNQIGADTIVKSRNPWEEWSKQDPLLVDSDWWALDWSLVNDTNNQFNKKYVLGPFYKTPITDTNSGTTITKAPFFETFLNNTSLYWDRAALTHWFGIKYHDYFYNSTNDSSLSPIKKEYTAGTNLVPVNRNFILTNGITGENRSYYGDSGFGANITKYRRPDRFNLSNTLTNSQWYIFPWVDGFGKSVAIGDLSKDGYIQVFGASSTRSNIELYDPQINDFSYVLRPVLPSTQNANVIFPNGYSLSSTETNSTIGQVSCILVNTNTYIVQKVLEINSGGSVDTYNIAGDNTQHISETGTYQTLSKLRNGRNAGIGHNEVMSSCDLSANKIVFKDGLLMWADQILSEGRSIISILKYNFLTDSFASFSQIANTFTTPRLTDASFVGDGFGLDIRYDNNILVTNCMVTKNNFQQDIGELLGSPEGSFRVDCLKVFEINPSTGFVTYIQDIFPAFDKLDTDKYSELLPIDYADNLLDINSITYENDTRGSLTWNIRLYHRYDVISDKILLKDPIEYSLFTPDFSINKNNLNNISNSQVTLNPYLYFTERYKQDTVYYDYSQKSQFIVENKSLWSQIDSLRLGNTSHDRRTPVFFVNVPSSAIDSYGNLEISIILDNNSTNTRSSINLDNFVSTSIPTTLSETPKLILYKVDPRESITPNGPSNTNTNTDIVNFIDGIFSTYNSTINKSNPYYKIKETYPALFRGGAADLFSYGNLAGSSPEITPKELFVSSQLSDESDFLRHYFGGSVTLGSLFDQSFNKAGNTNKGIISWMSPDNYKYLSNPALTSNIVKYATLQTAFNVTSTEFVFILPYSVWKNFLIRGSLIKNSNNNRPLFNSFTRIKHGVVTTDSPFAGVWDYVYDDINRASYTPTIINSSTIPPQYTLAIGFTLEDIVDQQQADIAQENYQYSNISSSSYTNSDNLKLMNNVLSINQLSRINSINITASITSLSNLRYKTKFHKVAYFKYNNEIYDEVQKNILVTNSNVLNRYSFGKLDFVPLVTGLNDNSPIIRMGKTLADSYAYDIGNGSFSQSIQILTSENTNYGSDTISNLYVDNNQNTIYTNLLPTGLLLDAYFSEKNLLGNFDILDPNYLSLSIRTKNIQAEDAPLYIKFSMSSGITPLYTNGFTAISTTMPLKIGQNAVEKNTTLFVKPPSFNFASLYINEIQPSGNAPLYVSGPDVSGQLTLSFRPPYAENITLFINGPIQNTGTISLSTRGKTLMPAQNTLYVDGIGFENETSTLNIVGVFSENNAITLAMNLPTSGSTTLQTYGAFPYNNNTTLVIKSAGNQNNDLPLFIGTQFEFLDKKLNLAIKDTERTISKTRTLNVRGRINSANNLKNGESNYTLARLNHVLDINSYAELPVSLVFNNETTLSNSITHKNIIGSEYAKTTITNTPYFGAQAKNNKTKNPAFITKQLDVNNNKTNAFYSDESNNFGIKNSIIERHALDSNGINLIAAYTNNSSASIDIYDIIENQYTAFKSKIFIGLDRSIPNTPQSQDYLYGANGIAGYPLGDSFVSIRRAIKQYFLPAFTNANLIDVDTIINDLKISDLGKCAISLRAKFNYANNTNNQTKYFNIIILFDISDLSTGISNISPYVSQTTYYVTEYHYHILEESGEKQNKHSSGYNIAFSGEDLYFDRRLGQWGQIWKLSKNTDYNVATQVIDFGTHPDVDGYINPNNTIYIPENNKKAAFGVPLKIYDNNGEKLMFIGAQLFDPYVFNTLTQTHIPNAIGAVYIYKQPIGSSNWNYFGAVYGKGNTSFNVLNNISDYKSSSLDNQEYALFGYDFDYSDGNLIVSEPGGNGEDAINGGRAYLFKINDTITLQKQYLYSDINTLTTSTISIEDDFLSSVVLLNPDNPITFSSDTNGNSIIHSLHNASAFVNSLAYITSNYTTSVQAKNNLNNENKYYDTSSISIIDNNLVERFSTILSMQKLNFGNGQYKLGLIREFYSRINFSGYNQYLNKLSIIDINNEPFGLYISGPNSTVNNLPLSIDTFDISDQTTTLFIDTYGVHGTGLNMIALSNTSFGEVPLHMESINNNASTLFMDGTFVPNNSFTSLYIDTVPENRLITNIKGVGIPTKDAQLFIGGNTVPDFKRSSTLFIGQEINQDNSTSLYLIGAGTLGFLFEDGFVSVSISGRGANINDTFNTATLHIEVPDSAIVNSGSSLYITTDIPPTGADGLYLASSGINTFIAGNNDAQIFAGKDGGSTLSIVSTIGVTGIAPLYIERPFANLMSLYIKDQNPTGVFTASISGAYLGSGDMSLSISPPTANTLNIITRGFLE